MGKLSKEEARARSNANLRPVHLSELPPEEALAIRRKGQAAQAKVLKRRRALRAICDDLLGMECPTGAAKLDALTEAAKELAAERGQALDVYEAGLLAQVARMLQGDTRAAEYVRDSAGDKPGEVVQLGEGMTDGDRDLLRRVARRVGMDEPGADAGGSGGADTDG